MGYPGDKDLETLGEKGKEIAFTNIKKVQGLIKMLEEKSPVEQLVLNLEDYEYLRNKMYQEIDKATNRIMVILKASEGNLGSGSFGTVYKTEASSEIPGVQEDESVVIKWMDRENPLVKKFNSFDKFVKIADIDNPHLMKIHRFSEDLKFQILEDLGEYNNLIDALAEKK